MNAEEAKTKWCPLVRADNSPWGDCFTAINCNDKNRNPEWSRCIGPDCALWREECKQQGTGQSMGQCGLVVPFPVSSVI